MRNMLQIDHIMLKQRASNAWSGIIKANEILTKVLQMMVCNGHETAFWLDI